MRLSRRLIQNVQGKIPEDNEMSDKIKRLAAAVLLGGKSSRMGRDKAELRIHFEAGDFTFVQKLASELSDFEEKYLSENSSQNCTLDGFTVVRDAVANIGPLGGIYSVLSVSKSEFVLFTACDMPMLTKAAIMHLVDSWKGEDMCIAVTGDGRHPLVGIYGKACLGCIEELVEQQTYKPAALLNMVNSKTVDMSEYAECFLNINTAEDYLNLASQSV